MFQNKRKSSEDDAAAPKAKKLREDEDLKEAIEELMEKEIKEETDEDKLEAPTIKDEVQPQNDKEEEEEEEKSEKWWDGRLDLLSNVMTFYDFFPVLFVHGNHIPISICT